MRAATDRNAYEDKNNNKKMVPSLKLGIYAYIGRLHKTLNGTFNNKKMNLNLTFLLMNCVIIRESEKGSTNRFCDESAYM